MKNNMEYLINEYKKTLSETKKLLFEIVKNDLKLDIDVPMFYAVLEKSMERITANWLSGKKYVRTLFMKNAMKEEYPKKILDLSLSIDAIINILDDILDEEPEKNLKIAYIIELIRVLAVFTVKISDDSEKKKIEKYFNKIISIAIGESIYKELIKKEANEEKTEKLIAEVYSCRSLDMDIFVELPLLESSMRNEEIKKILQLGRNYRILNLIKKDIDDIEHDKKNHVDTGITLAIKKNRLNETVKSIIKKTLFDTEKIILENEKKLVDNFKMMIEKERSEIERRLDNIKH